VRIAEIDDINFIHECRKRCEKNNDCTFFNWNRQAKKCFLRNQLANVCSLINNSQSVVGVKNCRDFKLIWPEVFAGDRHKVTASVAPENITNKTSITKEAKANADKEISEATVATVAAEAARATGAAEASTPATRFNSKSVFSNLGSML
jgi:hypothetical protein